MLFYLTMNLYVPFGILFDPKRKIGLQERIWRIRLQPIRHMALPPWEQRPQYLRYQGLNYTNADIADFEHRDDGGAVVFTSRAWMRLFDTRGPLVWELILEFLSTLRYEEVLLDLDALDAIQFQLGGARRRMSWRQFIVALGLHTGEEMESLGFDRLQICEEIDDTWAWIALGPERQTDAAAGALGAAEDAPAVDEGDQAIPAPVQAPPPPQLLPRLCHRGWPD
ncbi:hypothetical protein Tco_0364170 [Tanacetum coccineum]